MVIVNVDGSSFIRVFLFLFLVSFASGFGYECDNVDQTLKCESSRRCYSTLQKCNGVDDCGDNTDEENCTSVGVTKQLILTGSRSRQQNLAWLITPVILGIGVLYAVYKCFKDGLCHVRHMRRRREAHGSYFALDQISFYSMTPMPQTHIGSPGHHLMMVHNHSFAMAVGELAPPSGGEDEQGTLTPPPTYAEAVNSGLNNAGFAPVPQEDPDLPPYKESATPPPPITPTSSVSPMSQPIQVSPPLSPRLPQPSAASLRTPPLPCLTRIPPPPSSPRSTSSQPSTSPTSSPSSPQSPRIPPPPPSPRQPVMVPSLQQLLQSTIRVGQHGDDSRSSSETCPKMDAKSRTS